MQAAPGLYRMAPTGQAQGAWADPRPSEAPFPQLTLCEPCGQQQPGTQASVSSGPAKGAGDGVWVSQTCPTVFSPQHPTHSSRLTCTMVWGPGAEQGGRQAGGAPRGFPGGMSAPLPVWSQDPVTEPITNGAEQGQQRAAGSLYAADTASCPRAGASKGRGLGPSQAGGAGAPPWVMAGAGVKGVPPGAGGQALPTFKATPLTPLRTEP